MTWATVRSQRCVLAVTRNVVSTARLLDVLPVFESDPRVQVRFTIAPQDGEHSAFVRGTPQLLERIGAVTVGWDEAVAGGFDLALSASYRGDLSRLRAPLVLMGHGAGHNRYVSSAQGTRLVPGLSRELLVRDGRVLPAALVLSGQEQLTRLQAACPQAVPVASVVGDPCFDRLLASVEWREEHRLAMGLRAGQRLVLVSSTWRGMSALGRWPRLAAQLLAALPSDEFAVGLVAHPNVSSYHGDWQVRAWLADALRAGLPLVSPVDGWRSALLAADLVVGDHGSVTLYGAALGLPVLLAATGNGEVAVDSPAAAFAMAADQLDPDRDLGQQVRDALKAARSHAELLAPMLGARGEALSRLRSLCYGLLDLSPPSSALFAAPVPAVVPAWQTPTAYDVFTGVDGRRVRVERFPAAVPCDPERPPSRLPQRHLLVDEREPDRRKLHHAAIVVGAPDDPLTWTRAVLSRFPGCRLAAALTPQGCLLRGSHGELVQVRAASDVDLALLASASYAQLAAGRPADDLGGRISLGGQHVDYVCAPVIR